jgi:hypothetical protein
MNRVWLALPLLLVTAAAGRPDDVAPETPYFPLRVGMFWQYRAPDGGLRTRVAKQERIGGVLCVLLENVKDGQVQSTEHLAVRPDGVYRYTLDGARLDPPECVLKLPPRPGTRWQVPVRLGDKAATLTYTLAEEEVTVPAGKFKAVVARSNEIEISGQRFAASYWFAPGVGVVKQSVKAAGIELVSELTKFESQRPEQQKGEKPRPGEKPQDSTGQEKKPGPGASAPGPQD